MEGTESRLSKFKLWSERELSKLLGSAIENEILDYLLAIQCEKDLVEYVEGMIDATTPASNSFSAEFVRRWKQLQSSSDSALEESHDNPQGSNEDHMTSFEQEVMVHELRVEVGSILIKKSMQAS